MKRQRRISIEKEQPEHRCGDLHNPIIILGRQFTSFMQEEKEKF
jgi:hypothetical protein